MAEAAAGGGTGQGPVMLKNGQVIQNYEIVKPLGKGKFSIVYMAKRLIDNSMCALKKINIFDMMVPKQREKCLKEVRLLQSMDHPNIVKLKDSFIDNNELLIIVEWAEKGDLKRLIRRAASMDIHFKDTEMWEYSRQLASALDHMHQKRIMHRDLKPANIFVSMDGSLKLGDLGLGRFFSSQTLEAFSKVGTPLYMSPEVLRGAGYDMRSDVWSLGCVLYELVMLRSPFKSDQQLSLYDLFVRISKGDYPPLQESVGVEFRELVSGMLALDPEKRLHCSQVLEVCTARVATFTAGYAHKDEAAGDKKASQLAGAIGSRPSRPSPLLVMDDIVEKLKLLGCEEQFLRPRGYPFLHRCFFVQKVVLKEPTTQFEVMYELLQWLLEQAACREAKSRKAVMRQQEEAADVSAGPPCKVQSRSVSNASQPGLVAEADAGAGDAAAGRGAQAAAHKRSKGDPDDLIRGIVTELAGRGIQISAEATISQLRQGYGEGVCLILNELINQELVGRDFHFEEPVWGEAPAGPGASAELAADEVDEEDDLISEGSQAVESHASDELYGASCFDAAVMERSLAGSAVLDQVHEAEVDPEAWRVEFERVKPHLCISSDLQGSFGGWQGTVAKTRELSLHMEELCKPLLLPEGIRACCRHWQRDLQELRCHEDRLNARFSDTAADTVQLRAAAATESEAVSTLQTSVSNLSETLAGVMEELEKRKSEAAVQTEGALDNDKVPALKKAIMRIREESQQIELRIGCVQTELMGRQHHTLTKDQRDAAARDQPSWYAPEPSDTDVS
jgi:NIMA (never in mitosis gene a)-related kinase